MVRRMEIRRNISTAGFITIFFFPLRLNLPAVGNVAGLKKCALEDLFIANLCITIPTSVSTIRSSHTKTSSCACPTSTSATSWDCLHQRGAKKPHISTKSWMSLILDSFMSPKSRTSLWIRLAISLIYTTMSMSSCHGGLSHLLQQVQGWAL